MQQTITHQKFTAELKKLGIDTSHRNSWRRENWTHMGTYTPCLHLYFPSIPYPQMFAERLEEMCRMVRAGWKIAFKRGDYSKVVAFMGETPNDVIHNLDWLIVVDELHLTSMAPLWGLEWKTRRIGQLCQVYYRQIEDAKRVIEQAQNDAKETRKRLESELDEALEAFRESARPHQEVQA